MLTALLLATGVDSASMPQLAIAQGCSDAEFDRAAKRLQSGTPLQKVFQILGKGSQVTYQENHIWRLPEGSIEVAFNLKHKNAPSPTVLAYSYLPLTPNHEIPLRENYINRLKEGMTLQDVTRLFAKALIRKQTTTFYRFTKPSGKIIWARFQNDKFDYATTYGVLEELR